MEKFELDDEEYAKRNGKFRSRLRQSVTLSASCADTLLAYKQRNKLGRFADGMSDISQPDPPIPAGLQVGSRCQIAPLSGDASDDPHPRGTIRFVGEVSFGKGGNWVGVEYDEPVRQLRAVCLHALANAFAQVGKNDGVVEGKRYFTARPRHGAFVKPDRVSAGDFPERDPFDLDEDMEEM